MVENETPLDDPGATNTVNAPDAHGHGDVWGASTTLAAPFTVTVPV